MYRCLLTVSDNTKVVLTLNNFQKGGDGVARQNVITGTTLMTYQLWHYQLDGMAKEEDASTISS